ncbi:universal stress protein [Jannaschia ovalis]|uniref:Universal stress protein n=1 Tax=Jannaschia ovalis TaxID=3038773 RepID=A0ABY8LDX8_9RHOB|nr:universal stress protein [Jannaschia sp. GRR-S6-38]WGH78827.1 universal stress protein [Jannaschia sp. GRR-S6-38]
MSPILVATDLSARSDRAVMRAAHLARDTGAPLHIVHIVDDDLPAAVLQQQSEAAEEALRTMVAATPDLKDVPIEIDVEVGHLTRLVPTLARERDVGLVVLGTHRARAVSDLFAQPTLAQLLKGVDRPILVAIGRPETTWKRVLLGWDFSPAGDAAVALLRKLAPDAELTIMHAWQDPYMGAPYAFDVGAIGGVEAQVRAETAERLEKAAAEVDWPSEVHHEVAGGAAANVLMRHANERDTDLLCIGRHSRAGLARFLLGETAQTVALNADCDVLIAPPAPEH